MTVTGPNAGAGWYPAPSDARRIRYWDGRSWTQHSLDAQPAQVGPWAAPAPTTDLPNRRPWWHTWWAIVPGLVLCFPIGLVGLWRRNGSSRVTKSLVTAAVAVL